MEYIFKQLTNRLWLLGRGLFLLFLLHNSTKGQTPQGLPFAYDPATYKINYVRTWDATAPESSPNTLMNRALKDVKQATQYFDGLGRPLQAVTKQGSLETSTGIVVDLVSPILYDQLGRVQYQYLSFAATATDATKDDGSFKFNPFQQQVAFYNSQLDGQTSETNVGPNSLNWAYNKTNFEASALNRPTETYAPGVNWVGSEATATPHAFKRKYWNNTAVDDVKIWVVTNSNSVGIFGSIARDASNNGGVYPAGTLIKNITIDEKGNQVIEFKDIEGRIILKKVQLAAPPDDGNGSGYTGWLCTYYIYDDLNNLRCVIQPEGVRALAASGWTLTTTLLNEQCFRYEYDQRSRLTMKKIPGAEEVYMVYDARDRMVMTQDANMRNNGQWLFTKYDDFDRPVQTGIINNTNATFASNLQAAYTSTSYPSTTGADILSETFYNDYAWLNNYGSPLPSAYSNAYDIYFQGASNVTWPYAQINTPSTQIKDMTAGSRTKILGTSNYLYTVNFYNDKGRLIQVQRTNITGGVDIATTQYTWAGQLLVAVEKQQKLGGNAQVNTIVTQSTYDDLGRLVRTEKKVANTFVNGGTISPFKTIAQLQYDKLGQLKTKKLGTDPNNGGNSLESLTYDYNVRGWLLGVNRDYAKDANTSNFFGFDLGYDKSNNGIIGSQTYANPQYNGNIGGMVWKTKGDGEKRKYDFTYDAVNRLMAADFNQYSGNSFDKTAAIDFSVSNINYDGNGNILTMSQQGWKLGGSSFIDQLTYSYQTNSNKLQQVADASNDNASKLGDFKYDPVSKSATDYSYDVNGNLIVDNNKKISSTSYNHLNLPVVINVAGKGSISYAYDAAGNKLQKTVVDNTISPSKTTTTLYLGAALYENDVLQFVSHEEGRIRFNAVNTSFQYDYFLKDHLGNVRMVLTEEQRQDQYPASTLEGSTSQGSLSMVNYEKQFYTINDAFITQKSSILGFATSNDYQNNNGNPPPNNSYPTGYTVNSTAISQNLYKLNAATNKTGLGIVIKVMAGDRIDIHGKSFYSSTQTYNNSNSTLLTLADVISAFIGAPDNSGVVGKAVTSPAIQTVNNGVIPSTFFRGNNGESTTVPKAYINYIFFDEQFKYAGGNFSRVGSSGTVKNHWFTDAQLQNISVPKNGYLYVYVSNESNSDVFFDNLQVFHTRGPLLEETHYYPFGLAMSGISSKALNFGGPPNKTKFNGYEQQSKEFSDGTGLEWYYYKNRFYDNQVGRFFVQDRLADDYVYYTPYQFAGNEVPNAIDLDGLEPAYAGVNSNGQFVSYPAGDNLQRRVPTSDVNLLTRGGNTTTNNDLAGIASVALDFVPFVGQGKAIYEGLTGKDLITGDKLSPEQRALGALPIIGAVGKVEKAAAKELTELEKAESRAAKLSGVPRPGEKFTKAGKEAVIDLNKAKNEGKTICTNCGTETVKATKDTKGVTPAGNRTEVDHIERRADGGSGTPNNGQVYCRDCNKIKH